MLVDLGSYGFSHQLKFLLFSGRPLLLAERHYVEWYHHLLIPYGHYVPVYMNYSNLLNQTRWILEHEQEADRIGKNAQAFALENFTKEKLIERTIYAADNVLSSLSTDGGDD